MIQLNVNGRAVEVDADPETPLLWVLTFSWITDCASGDEDRLC